MAMRAHAFNFGYDLEGGQLGLADGFIALNKVLQYGQHANRGVDLPIVQLRALSTTRAEPDARTNGIVVAR